MKKIQNSQYKIYVKITYLFFFKTSLQKRLYADKSLVSNLGFGGFEGLLIALL